jgi:hypothetical protein
LRDHAAADFYRAIDLLSLKLKNPADDTLDLSDLEDDPLQDPEHPLTKLQPSVEHALLCIVESLAGADAALHVNAFLDDFAPVFSIPRMPEYE